MKSLNNSFYVEYTKLKIETTNTLCKKFGFDFLHSLNHLEKRVIKLKTIAFIDDNLSPFIRM